MKETSIGLMVGGLGMLFAVSQMAWGRFFSREGKASDILLTQLSERLSAQEAQLQNLSMGLDNERQLRRGAEDKVHALEMYVVRLEGELRRHGIEVPGSPVYEAKK